MMTRLALVLALGLVGCGSSSDGDGTGGTGGHGGTGGLGGTGGTGGEQPGPKYRGTFTWGDSITGNSTSWTESYSAELVATHEADSTWTISGTVTSALNKEDADCTCSASGSHPVQGTLFAPSLPSEDSFDFSFSATEPTAGGCTQRATAECPEGISRTATLSTRRPNDNCPREIKNIYQEGQSLEFESSWSCTSGGETREGSASGVWELE